MSGTTWTVQLDGKALTWSRLVKLWADRERTVGEPRPGTELDRALQATQVSPLHFDVAERLSSKQAMLLVVWMRAWASADVRSVLRVVPAIPTAEVARMAPHAGGKPVHV